MMRWLLLGLVLPLLLAPVRFQQGNETLLLQPSTAPTGPRGKVAVALPSPTVIDISPTRAAFPNSALPAAGGVASPTMVSPTPAVAPAVAARPPAPAGISPQQAALCVRALTMLTDLSAISMKQSGRENLVELSIAAAIAQVQAAQGQWPNLAGLRRGVPLLTPNRAELKQALEYSQRFCANPAAREAAGVGRPR